MPHRTFNITVRFLGGLTSSQRAVFEFAAARWTRIITADVPGVRFGGEILDAILARINRRARIVVCGLISQYNATAPVPGPYQFARVLIQRARVEDLENAPRALGRLFDGSNQGKLIIQVSAV